MNFKRVVMSRDCGKGNREKNMEQRHKDSESMPVFLIHEAVTPALLKELYPENQQITVNPLLSLARFLKQWFLAPFKSNVDHKA